MIQKKKEETARQLSVANNLNTRLYGQIRLANGRLHRMALFGKPVLERLLKGEPKSGWALPPHEYEALRQYLHFLAPYIEGVEITPKEIRITGHPVIARPTIKEEEVA
jgi:hypothetical protein